MARKTQQLHRQVQPLQHGSSLLRASDIGFLKTLGQQAAFVKPEIFFGELLNQFRLNTERLAHITNRAAGPVGGDGSCDGSVFVTVFGVNVLNDLFTPLMFKIHVNIRRLFAFTADETLKQQLALGRVNCGDRQAIAHR